MADENFVDDNGDARFRFAMSEDGMKLGVSRYFPPNGGEGPSVEMIQRQAAEAGVKLPIDDEVARQIIDAIHKDSEFRKLVLIRGIEVQEPQNASLVALGNIDFPTFPGDRFARKHPPLEARAGETIDGRITQPKTHFDPEDIEIQMGENVDFDPLTNSYVSQVWGMARLKEGTITVEPIPIVSEDAITVTGNLHHKDFKGQEITPARIDKEMRDTGVLIDLDLDDIDAKLKQTKQLGRPLLDQIIVEGKHPIPGRDGWLEYLVSTRELTGTEDEAGRLDFRNRGSYPMVDAGQAIGRLHPPTQGQGGIDIYGKTIPASAGKELHIHAGENIIIQEDEISFESKAKGIMVMERNTLSVTDCLLIHGNIDLNTGNVIVEHGSVKILGSIQAGFSVFAPKHIVVAGSVESTMVTAGGNIQVSGGILMPEGGKVSAKGDVIASYAANAYIEAGGDVYIANDTTNSEIHCEGQFIATRGKGIVQGGEIITSKGLKVNEIGSELGVATTVAVRIDHEEDEELRLERSKIKQAIQKIDDALGRDDPKVILERTPPEKRTAVSEVLKHRITLVKRRKTLSEQLNQLALARQEELSGIKIKAMKFIHPGAVIKFGPKMLQFTKRNEASTILWDETTRQITIL
jgi:hypothetical protein